MRFHLVSCFLSIYPNKTNWDLSKKCNKKHGSPQFTSTLLQAFNKAGVGGRATKPAGETGKSPSLLSFVLPSFENKALHY